MDRKEYTNSWLRVYPWALDYCRAMIHRPWWSKILFRLVIGRYAFREFMGMLDYVRRVGDYMGDYNLESLEYHKDVFPLRWW